MTRKPSAKRASRQINAFLTMISEAQALQEEIDRAGDIDSYIRKLEGDAEQLKRQLVETERARDAAQADLEQAKAQAAKRLADVEVEVEELRKKGRASAEQARLKAQDLSAKADADHAEAQRILAAARDEARAITAAAKRDVGDIVRAANQDKAAVEEEIKAAKAALKKIQRDAAGEQARVSAMKAEIESLRARLAS